jgi:peptidylprolyl isomerase
MLDCADAKHLFRLGDHLRIVDILGAIAAFAFVSASAATVSSDWRDVDGANLVLIDTRYGQIAVELAPEFAPHHVARVRELIRAHFYDGKSFYRVIDGFVAQGGMGEGTASTKGLGKDAKATKAWPPLKAEFDTPIAKNTIFTPLGSPDLFAPEAGDVNGFPAGRDAKSGRMWIVHCPGTFAFARDNGNDTATTEFYIVIGEAPRRLDRNLTAFGRVIDGMQYVQKLNRGNPDVDNGVIADPKSRDPIIRVRVAADLPAKERPRYQVMRTESAAFAAKKAAKLNPAPEFYHRKPPAVLDLCVLPAPVRRLPS